MEVLHLRWAALDVHKRTVVASVRLAEESKVTTEVKTFATTTAGLLAWSPIFGRVIQASSDE